MSGRKNEGDEQTRLKRRPSRRQDILRRTARLFLENGFDSTSLDKIADYSNVSKPGIYYHFRDKQEILATIMRNTMDTMQRDREDIAATSSSLQEQLRRVIHDHALGITKSTGAAYAMLIIDEADSLRPKDRKELVARRRAHLDYIRDLLEGLKREGSLYDVDTTVAAFSILGLVLWLGKWYRPRGRLSGEQVAEEVTNLVLQALIKEDRRESAAPTAVVNTRQSRKRVRKHTTAS